MRPSEGRGLLHAQISILNYVTLNEQEECIMKL